MQAEVEPTGMDAAVVDVASAPVPATIILYRTLDVVPGIPPDQSPLEEELMQRTEAMAPARIEIEVMAVLGAQS